MAGHSLSEGEGEARLLGCLGEQHILDLEVADGEVVLGDEALHGARAVTDLEGGAVALVGRRRARVVLGVQEACN